MRRWADMASACAHYRLAAGYPETFYGQVALARLDATPALHLNDTPVEAVRHGRDSKAMP